MGKQKNKNQADGRPKPWYMSEDRNELLLAALCGETERGQVLIAAEFLNTGLKWCIRLKARNEGSEEVAKGLLGRRQVLGDFGARIDVARVFGLILAEDFEALNTIRQIRNRFAHDAFKIRLDAKDLDKHAKTLSKYIEFRMCGAVFGDQKNPWLQALMARGITPANSAHETFLLGALLLFVRFGEISTALTGGQWRNPDVRF